MHMRSPHLTLCVGAHPPIVSNFPGGNWRPCRRHYRGRRRTSWQGIDASSSGREPQSLLEYELQVIKDAKDTTIDRWKDMYDEQAKDAMALGLPQSAVPMLPERPTQADIRQAADSLRHIMQSFESAAL